MPQESDARAGHRPAVEQNDWTGTARYEVVRCIGRGGMGSVYEARDRERGQRVALKTLLHFDPASLFMFKQEFRTLADVHHPNLVRLHEFVALEGERVFFSMELVRGTHFLDYVQRPGSLRRAEETTAVASVRLRSRPSQVQRRSATSSSPPSPEPETRPPSPADFDRLRPAMRQLVEGVQALHSAGKLHRDIKPSNVLVSAEGRVVLLDFGVATELPRVADENLREEAAMVGTVRYMAPEQAFGGQGMPASDWYSVGVILYEALLGHPPFDGSAVDILHAKLTADAPAPSAGAVGIPPDLEALCAALLARDPAARPTGAEILDRFAGTRSGLRLASHPASGALPTGRGPSLIGRERHLEELRRALDDVGTGCPITLRVGGPSGMGKSALVQRFLDEVAANGRAVVLRGRAYERESVPYKAVDALVDELSRHLIHILDSEGTLALPANVDALSRLFPVLRRVPAIGDVAEDDVIDPQRMRQRAFSAFRELLATLAQRRPLVLFVDDVQWGDVDSAALLLELVRPPSAPGLLLLLVQRDDDDAATPFLAELRGRWPEGAEVRDLTVGPLEPTDAKRLAVELLGKDDPAITEGIARESGGSPFLVEELARSSSGRLLSAKQQRITLEEVVGERLAVLPSDARRLVEIVAVGGRPLPVTTIGEAARIPAVDEAVALLTAERFVRSGLRDGREVVEAIHDRIRETIVAGLPEATVRAHHARLARALEATPEADPEALAMHLFGAGEKERASRLAERAAARAAAKLAFDQAARLYSRAVSAAPDSPDAHRLRLRLADALVLAGRGVEAARIYAGAGRGAPAMERADLERAAAEQLLMCGHVEEGTALLRAVLASWGMRLPTSPLGAILLLLVYRLKLAIRGLHFEERDPASVRPQDRARVDALYAVALGLSVVDIVLSACVQTRHIMQAFDVGHRLQVMRAASLEASHLAGQGGPESRRERELVAIVRRLADSGGDRQANQALFEARHGIRLFLRGRWKEARQVLDTAYARYPNNRASANSNSYVFSLYSLWFLGDLTELARRKTQMLADAEQRGDLYTTVNLRASWTTLTSLASDDVEGARSSVRLAMSAWSQAGYSIQHWQAMLIEAFIELYAGNGERAYERLARDARALRRSFLLKSQSLRGHTAYVRGLAAIASLDRAAPGAKRQLLAEAQRTSRLLEREAMPWTAPLASILAAAVAGAQADRARAIDALRAALEQAQSADMPLYAAAAGHRLGRLLDGSEGPARLSEAEAALVAAGVRVPERFAAMLVGRWS